MLLPICWTLCRFEGLGCSGRQCGSSAYRCRIIWLDEGFACGLDGSAADGPAVFTEVFVFHAHGVSEEEGALGFECLTAAFGEPVLFRVVRHGAHHRVASHIGMQQFMPIFLMPLLGLFVCLAERASVVSERCSAVCQKSMNW